MRAAGPTDPAAPELRGDPAASGVQRRDRARRAAVAAAPGERARSRLLSLPGGKIDPFETVQAALRREIAEELGVELVGEHLLCVADFFDPARGAHWVAPVYLVREVLGEPRNCEPEKHSDMGWFPLDDLPAPLTRGAAAAARQLRAPQP